MSRRFFTSESVTEGHPDKICDQISDAVLDAILEKDPAARVACETTVTTGLVHIMGEITTSCYVDIPAVARCNKGELPQLSHDAIIEAELSLRDGVAVPHGTRLPAGLADVCGEIDETNRLAALAAAGDRSALRECVEIDPALAGLDRLYCQDLVEKLMELHDDVIVRL